MKVAISRRGRPGRARVRRHSVREEDEGARAGRRFIEGNAGKKSGVLDAD